SMTTVRASRPRSGLSTRTRWRSSASDRRSSSGIRTFRRLACCRTRLRVPRAFCERSASLPALLELQRAFALALRHGYERGVSPHIAEDGFSAPERLRIYRNTCRSTLIEALRLSYPAVERLVGPEFFEHAAGQFVACHPARSGYLNDYGAGFAAFLAQWEPAGGLRYLPDVARFEWALSVAANAPDTPALDPAALAGPHAARLRLQPPPSPRLLG